VVDPPQRLPEDFPVKVKRWTLIAAVLGSGIVFLDSTIVPLALPTIGEELSSTLLGTLEAQSYIYYGYLLTLSALLILAGALNDFFGRRRMFAIGLVGFGATSVLCGLAPNMELLVLGRVLQGAAGAILVPGSLSILTATFTGEEQGRAFGIWAGASAATTILGPVVGGALVDEVSWRAAFLINVPLIMVALYATSRYVQESRDEEATGHFDWLGASVVGIAVGGLTFGTIRGQSQEWQDPVAFIALGVGAVAAVVFPILMARMKNPIVPLSLFRSRNFSVTNASTLVIYGAIYVSFQYMALYLIGVLGYSEAGYGVATIPGSLLLALFSTRFGKLADRYGPRIFMTVGPVLMGLGLLWLARIPADSSSWNVSSDNLSSPPGSYFADILPMQLLFGLGLTIMVAPLTTALMRSVPVRRSGVASAFNNAVSRVGPQLAGALLFIAITSSFYGALADEAPQLDTSSPEVREQVSPMNPADPELGDDVAAAARDASTDAFHLAMLAGGLMCFAGAAINGLGIKNEAAKDDRPQSEAVTSCAQSPPFEAPSAQASR
jgi:EmrB/QacA subfamily drug resistance transporter